jgi:PilZ domain
MDNRRASVRYQGKGTLFLRGTSSMTNTLAEICNASVTGVGLVLDESLRPGKRIIIELKTDDSSIPIDLPARVVHCTLYTPGRWLVGCRFESELSHDYLRLLCQIA